MAWSPWTAGWWRTSTATSPCRPSLPQRPSLPAGEALALLRSRGAEDVEHPGGTLLDHLQRTSTRLASWGASPDLVLAGLTHAAYGTDSFDPVLLGLDERDLLRAAVGDTTEALVHRYCSTDRAPFYRQLDQSLVIWTDRFTGASLTLDPPDVAPLVELTVANELDVVVHSTQVREEFGVALRALFERGRSLMSEAAWADVEAVLPSGP